jgi:hypothetical protein
VDYDFFDIRVLSIFVAESGSFDELGGGLRVVSIFIFKKIEYQLF